MHFVDNVNFIPAGIRRKEDFVLNLPHIVDARIRCAVYLDNIDT